MRNVRLKVQTGVEAAPVCLCAVIGVWGGVGANSPLSQECCTATSLILSAGLISTYSLRAHHAGSRGECRQPAEGYLYGEPFPAPQPHLLTFTGSSPAQPALVILNTSFFLCFFSRTPIKKCLVFFFFQVGSRPPRASRARLSTLMIDSAALPGISHKRGAGTLLKRDRGSRILSHLDSPSPPSHHLPSLDEGTDPRLSAHLPPSPQLAYHTPFPNPAPAALFLSPIFSLYIIVLDSNTFQRCSELVWFNTLKKV